MLSKYQPSGAVGALTPIVLAGMLISGAVGGVAYQFATEYSFFIILLMVIWVFSCIGLKWIVERGVRMAKCRNRVVGVTMGLLTGACVIAASHLVKYLEMESQIGQPGSNLGISEYVKVSMDTGWTIGKSSSGMPVQGVFVLLVWGVEAIAMIGFGVVGGWDGALTPYCEACNCSAMKVESAFAITQVADEMFQRAKSAESLNELLDLQGGGGRHGNAIVFTVTGCPTCDGVNTLAITSEKVFESHGKENIQRKKLHRGILLNQVEWELVVEAGVDYESRMKA